MASKKNNKKVKERNHMDIIDSVENFDSNYKHIIIVSAIVVIIFCAFYFLTVYITDKNTEKTDTTEESIISYTEVMVGRSFKLPETEYLVLYYDKSDEDLVENFEEVSNGHYAGVGPYNLYIADMSNAINKSYIGETSNTNPTKASELTINGPTLIHFRDGAVLEYLEGVDSILSYLG